VAAAAELRLEAQLSPRAAEDLAWLKKKLKTQFEGIFREEDGTCRVDLRAAGGKMRWFFGTTPELALARARATVEEKLAPNQRVVRG
jgi:hypothetical protein